MASVSPQKLIQILVSQCVFLLQFTVCPGLLMKVKNVSSLELFQHHSQRQERDLVLDWFWYILLKHLLALSTDFWLPFYISPFFLPFHYIRHFSLQIKSEARDKWRTSNKTCNLEILPSQVTYTHMVCVCVLTLSCVKLFDRKCCDDFTQRAITLNLL